mgnify:CR=1 FL=1
MQEIEAEELIRIILLIPEYFKDYKPVREKQISESQFGIIQQRNIHIFKYFQG